ncbi:MAG: tRNA (adenosine(37)-N6)-dimethylallyltransferase MiaA [Planctomycetia bacterium]|nr:tRNA (adenosine(37)-N6)-dimethylallyltransferase MiaA [Planctomycetia bacterium]
MNSLCNEELPVVPRITGAVFLSGPTASGKTDLAVLLARRINAEIISLDSMAIYKKMDIGTAKPTMEERAGIPHHLIDIIGPDEEYSLAAYLKEAHRIADGIRSRGKRVLFAGGTPLYLKGALRGIFDGPPADPDFRTAMEKEEAENGAGFLHERLKECDPRTADRLHPNDRRRIIRALEVFEKSGRPISYYQQQFDRPASAEEAAVFVLDWEREKLYDRINRRVDQMIEKGLLEEAQLIRNSVPPPGKTACQAVGYRELFDYFDEKTSLQEAIDLIKQHSRNFAKSQGTWFRSLPECRFFSVAESTDQNDLADAILTESAKILDGPDNQ